MRIRVGVDVGGTFTDCVAVDDGGRLLAHRKEPSTPPDVERGALAALEAVGSEHSVEHVVHGTTVATNALVEGRLGRIGLIATEGFRDVLVIGTQMRPDLYDVMQRKPEPLVPRHLRVEVPERIAADGSIVRPLDEAAVRRAARGFRRERVDAVAVCLLFSYVDGRHERRIAEILAEELPDVDVALSSDVTPMMREYPRTSTTVVNAALRAVVGPYLRRFREGARSPVLVLQSGGGVVPAGEAAFETHRLLVSGPAGGVVGATAFARARGATDVVTMDMGGTSFDTCLVIGGEPAVRPETTVGGHPVLASTVDIVTVGAGGGSIAAVDQGGALVVGPASAGAVPGPACYGRGGRRPTVTDANLVIGRLDADRFLDGRLSLDLDAARRAVADEVGAPLGIGVEEAAFAILEVATATMARALRVVSVGRGRDPADLPLVAFGGAGPLAAATLASEVGAPSIIVPPLPGFVSAVGLLSTDLRTEVARTVLRTGAPSVGAEALREVARPMTEEAVRRLNAPARSSIAYALDCRYAGQGFELTVPLHALTDKGIAGAATSFHAAHDAVFGHAAVEESVEIVALRVTATAPGGSFAPSELARSGGARHGRPAAGRKVFDASGWLEVPVYERPDLPAGWSGAGPLLVEEGESTAWVPGGWRADVDPFGSLILEREGGPRAG
jgi:N-methylhydantoinase A